MVKSPKRSTSESVGGMPHSRMSDNPNAAKQATDAMATAVHTRSRASSGRNALTNITIVAAAWSAT